MQEADLTRSVVYPAYLEFEKGFQLIDDTGDDTVNARAKPC
jgi:hypothetical protein